MILHSNVRIYELCLFCQSEQMTDFNDWQCTLSHYIAYLFTLITYQRSSFFSVIGTNTSNCLHYQIAHYTVEKTKLRISQSTSANHTRLDLKHWVLDILLILICLYIITFNQRKHQIWLTLAKFNWCHYSLDQRRNCRMHFEVFLSIIVKMIQFLMLFQIIWILAEL